MLNKIASKYIQKQSDDPNWFNSYITTPLNNAYNTTGEFVNNYMIQPTIAGANAVWDAANKYVVQPTGDFVKNIAKNDAESYHQRLLDDTIGWVGEQLGVNKPYKPFDINSVKKGDTVNVAFSGAWDGSQNGSQGLYNGVFNDLGEHAAMFRYNDVEAADKLIKELKAKGVNVNLHGHSWGSSPANTMAFKHNIPKVTLIDPVKRGLKIHPNAKVYAPKDDDISNMNNFIAFVGGRQTDSNSIRVRGDHASMVNDAVADSFGTSVDKLRKKQQDQTLAELRKKLGGSNPVKLIQGQRPRMSNIQNWSLSTPTK